MKNEKLNIGILGCGFTGFFLPAYLCHPNIECVGLGDANAEKLTWLGDMFGISRRHASLEDMLEADYDAIHIMTPIHLHAQQTIAVLRSGKHCACAVPMATSLEDMRTIAAVQRDTGKKYMMFEPNACLDEVIFVKNLIASGEMGRLQFLRGLQHYNLNTHPVYWQGFPPMHYISHAIAPLLEIAGRRAASVRCLGSGGMRKDFERRFGNPFPIETAIFSIADSDVAAEVTIIFFETAVQGREGFDAYGEKVSFKWREFADDKHGLIRLGPKGCEVSRIDVPASTGGAPPELAEFMRQGSPQAAFARLIHEFLMSIIQNREPHLGPERAFAFVAPGLCAHESGVNGGTTVNIPELHEPEYLKP